MQNGLEPRNNGRHQSFCVSGFYPGDLCPDDRISAGAPVPPSQPAVKPAPGGAAPNAPAEANRPAPVSAEPETTTASYGDWLLRCQRAAGGASSPRVCGIVQTVQAQGQQNPIMQISIAAPAAKEPMKLRFSPP
jgi:invasion protein IalB